MNPPQNQFRLKPRHLFLIDGLGALVTASVLWGVLKKYPAYFGMPSPILTYLSMAALVFFMYSILCFFLVKKNQKPWLRIIAITNALYCCLTLGLILYYYQRLTVLDLGYFLSEIMVIGVLVFFELRASNHSSYTQGV